ncbi:hypothetical protein OEZ85_004809 [Tetradesmus obliquus]|uniref:BCNT-C domain-containing protein n=1 Tax=Tetradesmus obliquus TaxID=3088 RepID=A0ABY8ULA1_TETOB|nr:hypothetical protein OEZ85_004809 [Tetradesmus obliquus]
MASLANANLPSSDEEDDDYNPTLDPTGEKEPGQQQQQQGGANRKRRGAFAAEEGDAEKEHRAAAAAEAAKTAAAAAADDGVVTPAQAAKKARIGAMWEQLQVAATGSVGKLSRSSISLASLCSNTDPKKKRNTDLLWMRNLGITPGSKGKPSPAAAAAAAAATAGSDSKVAAPAPGATPPPADAAATPAADAAAGTSSAAQQQQQPDERSSALRAAAAAALAAAKEGALGGVVAGYNKVMLKETRRFAGKDIEVELQVDRDSKEAQRAAEKQKAAAAAGGLDAFLQQIESKKKVTVLDKTKMDWQGAKAADAGLQEELEAHRRSDKQYLERQDFLKRAELREYELERDKRLASDVRLRGRL